MDRIAALEQFIQQSPDDPFPRYGLAMEYKNQGRHDEAWQAFEVLLQRFPDYVPTYLMAGSTLADLGRRDAAAEVLQKGIQVAGVAGDGHAASELRGALADLDDS